MKHRIPFLVALAVIAAVATVAWATGEETKASGAKPAAEAHEHHHAEGAEMTLTGEVLDLTCYASHPETGAGPEHASCARTCIEKGLPVGLLVGDVVYIPVMKDHNPPNKAFAPHAGARVTVKGVTKEVGGIHFIEVTQVAAAGASK